MNIQNIVSQSNLELILCVLAAVAALRLITAVSFSAGRKAGQAAVFSAEAALVDARGAASRSDAAAADSRKWLEAQRKESAKVDRNWQAFTYEHRSYVAQQLAYAEASLERALRMQIDANEALDSAREVVAKIQAESLK